MKFKVEDWETMVERLQRAREMVGEAREKRAAGDESAHDLLLDDAVVYAWRFGEYAVNVVLELAGANPERRHRHADRIEELQKKGWLKLDYRQRLENLSHYRLKADYAGYSSAPSVHYSTADVERCLDVMDSLRDEVSEHLRKAGKIQ